MIGTAAQLAAKMQERKTSVRQELQVATRLAAPRALRASKQVMRREIYSIPIPRSSTGRMLWRRTANLLNSEKVRWQDLAVLLYNTARYAIPRYKLGTPDGKQIKSPGVRSVQWHHKAWEESIRETFRELRRRALKKALED